MANRWLRLLASCAAMVALGAAGAEADSVLDRAISEFQVVPMAGEAPPPFALERLDGTTLRPDDLKGRAVLIYFWATW